MIASTPNKMLKDFDDVSLLIKEERLKQIEKWGDQNHPHFAFLSILSEEIGELAKEINEGADEDRMQSELVQIAAVAYAWIESLKNK